MANSVYMYSDHMLHYAGSDLILRCSGLPVPIHRVIMVLPFSKSNKRAMMALNHSPKYHSTQGEYDLIRGKFLRNYFEIRP